MAALRMRPIVLFVALGAVPSLVQGCKGGDRVTDPLPQQPPAVRVASSFVHCVELGKAQCIDVEQASQGWDALFLLSWLGAGSPVAILEALPGQLAAHTDLRAVEVKLVEEVERYASAIRGAECDADRAEPFTPLVDEAARAAVERLENLGLLRGGMQTVVERLSEEAHRELEGGHLVHMHCTHDPHRLYLAVRGGEQERQRVVGMTTLWPEHLGGQLPESDIVGIRLRSRALGLSSAAAPIDDTAIDPWLPFTVEEF